MSNWTSLPLTALYSNSNPVLVTKLSVLKEMKALLVDEIKLGGGEVPQYFPIKGEALD